MTRTINTTSRRRLSARLAAGIAIAAILALGTFATPANAEWGDHNHGYHNWNGGYYNAPPVVYGSPYGSPYGSSYYGYSPYYAPPLVYGPGVGISLPGINIGIR